VADEMTRKEFVDYMKAFEACFESRINALRETTEQGFAEMRTQRHQQTTLLQAAIEHVRCRVERLERRK
jgi:hypothetical protein